MEKEIEDPRSIPNNIPDWTHAKKDFNLEDIKAKIKVALLDAEDRFLKKSPPESKYSMQSDNKEKKKTSIYSGTGGNVVVYWKLYQFYKHTKNEKEMKRALENALIAFTTNKNLQEAITKSREEDSPSFFASGAGLYTMGYLIYNEMGDEKNALQSAERLAAYEAICYFEGTELELLYGIVGYLYCLIVVMDNGGPDFSEKIKNVVKELLKQGSKEPKASEMGELIFRFGSKGSIYLGAVHGLMGILYLLMEAIDRVPSLKESPELLKTIQDSSDYMIKQQFESGNFPSSKGKTTDTLVHFCHGAAGSISFLLAADTLFGSSSNKYINAALKAGECLWKRGILRKGNGLCHGISGNAYALFSLYRYTKDEKWLYRAFIFTQLTFNPIIQKIVKEHDDGSRICIGIADTPYSLMEGMGGAISLYCDSLLPLEAMRFPGYEV